MASSYLSDYTYIGAYQPRVSPVEELPNYRIEVELRLCQRVKQELISRLQEQNMEVTRSGGNIIKVTGTPPQYDYNEQSVLAVVKEYHTDAEIIQ